MYLKFIWQQQKLQTVCFLLSYPEVKHVRLGYIGTCNMEHIGTPPSAFKWVSQCFCYQLTMGPYREQYIVNDTVSKSVK